MIQVEHKDNKNIMVRMEFADTREMGAEFMAFLDAIMESKLTLDVFTRMVDVKISENKSNRK